MGGWVWGRNVRRALFDIGLLVPSDDAPQGVLRWTTHARCAPVLEGGCAGRESRVRACVHSKPNVSEQSSCRGGRCAIWRALAPSALALTRAGCRRMARDGARGTHAFERKSGEVPTRPTGEQSGEGEGEVSQGRRRRCRAEDRPVLWKYLRSLTECGSSRVESLAGGGNKH